MSDAVSAPGPVTEGTASKRTHIIRPTFRDFGWVSFAFILLILFSGIFWPRQGGIKQYRASPRVQEAYWLGLAMYSYSRDNDGKYPDGNSSTEVFQKLLDGGYVTDPAVFYFPFAGKIKPVSGQKLKSDNICWDVTSGVDSSAPDSLPLLFMTGYKVTYAPGGAAVPIIKLYSKSTRTWTQWSVRAPAPSDLPGIAVSYKGYNTAFLHLNSFENPDGTIPNFVPPDFKPDGKTYRQLTPDGPLP